MTNYKQLCIELLSALENEGHAHWLGGPDGDPLIEQARAALAEPVPEGQTPSAELSPAAQAVLNAFRADWKDEHLKQDVKCLAAALRAAVTYTKVNPGQDIWQCDANELLAIATELEAQ